MTRKHILRTALVTLCGLVVLVGWQLFTTLAAADDARRVATSDWARASASRTSFLAHYTAECERERSIRTANDPAKIISRPLTISECVMAVAKQNGLPVNEAASLVDAMETAVDAVKAPIPLRWF